MVANDIDRTPDKVQPVLSLLRGPLIGIQLPDRRGEWRKGGEFQQLDALGSSFFDVKDLLGPEAFLSIPDVWAQVEAYRIALTSERQKSYARFVGEWRGLLAAIALQREYGFQITPDEYDFTRSSAPMAKVLAAHPPRSRIVGSGPWQSIGLLRLRKLSDRGSGVVVGMAVPNVIVVTAKSYRLQLAVQLARWEITLPWLLPASELGGPQSDERHYFADPCDDRFADRIGAPRFKLLEAYIAGLSADLIGNDAPLAAQIKSRLDRFAQDAQRCAGRVRVRLKPRTLATLSPSVGLPSTFTIYEDDGDQRSDFQVALRDGLSEHFSGAVLIDASLAKQLGPRAREWKVWKGYTAADLQTDPALARRIADQIKADCEADDTLRDKPFLPVIGDDLFTSAVVQIDGEPLVSETGNLRNFAYPLTPLVLTLLDPAALRQAISVEPAGDRVTVKLSLPRAGTEGNIDLIREYRRGGDAAGKIIDKTLPEAIDLWPNVSLPGWTWNFGFFAGNTQLGNAVAIDGYASLRAIQSVLKQEAPSRKASAVEKLGATLRTPRAGIGGAEGWDKVDLRTNESPPGYRLEVHRIYEYPEAILLRSDRSEGDGLILTRPLRDLRPGNLPNSAVVGIDFGTTNTTVYSRIRDKEPARVDLKRRYWSPRGDNLPPKSDEQGSILKVYNELFPRSGRVVPFLTALRDRTSKVPSGPLQNVPVLAATVFLESDANRYIEEIIKLIPTMAQKNGGRAIETLEFNLKWSSVNWDRRLNLYLSQIVLQSVIELLDLNVSPAAIGWRFSYPEAFDPGKTARFKEQTRDLVHRIYEALGDDLRPRDQNGRPTLPAVTADKESVSAARFFVAKSDGGSDPGHVVTIDVGGGTADISIWHERQLVWRSSIGLAGKAMLVDYIGRRSGILRDLLIAKGETTANGHLEAVASLKDIENYKNAAEAVLNSSIGRDLFTARHLMSRDSGLNLAQSGPVIIRRTKLAFGAILYYIGLAYRSLRDQKDANGEPLLPISGSSDLRIYVGGRASLLISNLFDDQDEKDDFLSLFTAASGQAFATSAIKFSHLPKEEVAFGLVVGGDEWNNRYEAKDRARSVAVPAGEVMSGALPNGKHDATVYTDMRTFDPNKPWQIASLDGFDEFRKLCRRYLHLDVILKGGARERVLNAVNDVNKSQRAVLLKALKEEEDSGADADVAGIKDDNVTLEPPFIRTVREVLRLNAEEADASVVIAPYGEGAV
jgi:hypothetical protein